MEQDSKQESYKYIQKACKSFKYWWKAMPLSFFWMFFLSPRVYAKIRGFMPTLEFSTAENDEDSFLTSVPNYSFKVNERKKTRRSESGSRVRIPIRSTFLFYFCKLIKLFFLNWNQKVFLKFYKKDESTTTKKRILIHFILRIQK